MQLTKTTDLPESKKVSESTAPRIIAKKLLRGGGFVALLLYAYVVILPSVHPLPEAISLYDGKRILQVVLLLANALWLLASFKTTHGPFSTYTDIPVGGRRALGVLLVVGCISSTLAAFPRYALLEVFHLVLIAGLALSVAHLYRRRIVMSDSVIVGVVLLSALLYIVSFSVGFVMSQLIPGISVWPESHIGFGHIRFFNQFQSWTLPLIVLPALMFSRGSRRIQILLMVPAAIWWMLLFASGGRGTMVGIAAALIFILLVFGRKAAPWLKLQGAAAVAGAVAYGLLFKLISATDASLLDRNLSDMGRFHFWRRAAGMIQENWLIGVGPMHHADFTGTGWAHPHSVLFQWGVEWGVPATLLLIAVVVWAVAAWVRQSRPFTRPDVEESDGSKGYVRIALTASLATAGTHAFFSGITIMPMSQTVMALIAGWMLGIFLERRAEVTIAPATRFTPVRRGAVAAVIVAAIGIVIWATIPDVLRLEERSDDYVEATNDTYLHPRYWLQGNIRY